MNVTLWRTSHDGTRPVDVKVSVPLSSVLREDGTRKRYHWHAGFRWSVQQID